jgi:hypothetical protein
MNKYGPNSPQVELFIERLKVMTDEEVKTLVERLAVQDAAWDAAWAAARNTAWDAAWNTARDAARNTAWDAARNAAWNTAWDATWNTAWAAQAIVVMDLITEEQFQILTELFAEILVELGIVWFREEARDLITLVQCERARQLRKLHQEHAGTCVTCVVRVRSGYDGSFTGEVAPAAYPCESAKLADTWEGK